MKPFPQRTAVARASRSDPSSWRTISMVKSAARAAIAASAAHTGMSAAPTIPMLSGTSMIVAPLAFLTMARRALPSRTSSWIFAITPSTLSRSSLNVLVVFVVACLALLVVIVLVGVVSTSIYAPEPVRHSPRQNSFHIFC